MADPLAFSGEVLATGRGGHAVLVPADVVRALGRDPAVLARVNGAAYPSRLARYGGRSYLGLRVALLRELGVGAGDVVTVELSMSPTAATAPTAESVAAPGEPDELVESLAADPAARAAYDLLAAEARAEYARWISGADSPAVRTDRVARLLRRLHRA